MFDLMTPEGVSAAVACMAAPHSDSLADILHLWQPGWWMEHRTDEAGQVSFVVWVDVSEPADPAPILATAAVADTPAAAIALAASAIREARLPSCPAAIPL
jgi:hypothetical protein